MAAKKEEQAPEQAAPQTGIFPSVDFKGRPRMVQDKPGSELRLRSIKDGGVFGFLMDLYDGEGRPNQSQMQLIRNLNLRTEVNGNQVPIYYLDPGSARISVQLGKGLPTYDVPTLTPELLAVIESNKRARESMKSGQQAVVDSNLSKPAKEGDA